MDMIVNKPVDCSVEDDMQVVFGMLDEAIDDYENGRLLTEEECWDGIRAE